MDPLPELQEHPALPMRPTKLSSRLSSLCHSQNPVAKSGIGCDVALTRLTPSSSWVPALLAPGDPADFHRSS